MATCPKCELDVRPVGEFLPGRGVVNCCPQCGAEMGDEVATENQVATAPTPAPVQAKPPSVSNGHGSVVDMLRTKLAAAEARITDVTEAKREARTLRRMLAIAEKDATR